MVAVKRDRTYYKNSKKWRDHEREMALIHMMASDPDMKYYIGAAAGMGVTWVAAMLGTAADSTKVGEEEQIFIEKSVRKWKMVWGPLGPIPWSYKEKELVKAEEADRELISNNSSLAGIPINELMLVAGESFTGLNVAILIIKALFGTGGMGEVLKGIGEIVPG